MMDKKLLWGWVLVAIGIALLAYGIYGLVQIF
jgi:hypothetical protein